MMDKKLNKQLKFILEVDKMKNILRQTLLMDKSRQENDAEHSWHFALIAFILSEYAPENVNIDRVIKMALVHDLVEVYAGDTFAYDEKGNEDKLLREKEAADKLFGILPEEQGKELHRLWEEFDAMETPDSIYACAIDRLQPFLSNYITNGHTWVLYNITSDKVYARMDLIRTTIPKVWPIIVDMIEDSIEKGFLKRG